MANSDNNPRVVRVLEAILLVPLVFAGAYFSGRELMKTPGPARPTPSNEPWTDPAERALDRTMPPGPPRVRGEASFSLNEANATAMTGMDEPSNERWADVAGNYYNDRFIARFSYEKPPPDGPRMFLRVEPKARTLLGRLEIQGAKPNFAYQIKVRGRYGDDPEGFRRIGYTGRWRLPGGGTNFTDKEFENTPNKENATAYVLFDYVVTDSQGNAVREFALDSSLHVLWNVDRQRVDPPSREVSAFVIDASNPAVYARPKDTLSVERIWAEPEVARYKGRSKEVRLPTGRYQAEIALTEESWHTIGNDSGYWATVAKAPVTFEIVE